MKPAASSLRSPQRLSHSSAQRRQHAPQQLPQLPRFHPANFASATSSSTTTPDTTLNSPQPPLSPRHDQTLRRHAHGHGHAHSHAHAHATFDSSRQLYLSYQRELISRGSGNFAQAKPPHSPSSPRLEPLGSPGPVTPLELEGNDDYLFAGAKNAGLITSNPAELVDKLVAKESRLSVTTSSSRSASRPNSRAGSDR